MAHREDESSIGLLYYEKTQNASTDHASGSPTRSRTAAKRTLQRIVSQALVLLQRLLLFLLPSFIAARLTAPKDASTTSSRKPRPTAYLDGLRGIAAWAVMNSHLQGILDRKAEATFLHPGDNHEIWKLPVVRLITAGGFAVCLFFVISGYALSISPVLAMRKTPRDAAAAMRKLASSVIRRPARLFVPCWAASLLVFALIRVGYFEWFIAREETLHSHYTGWSNLKADWPPRDRSFLAQAAEVLWVDLRFLEVYQDWQPRPWLNKYCPPTWTIPLEFRASLVLYLTHAVTFFIPSSLKRCCLAGILIATGLSVKALDFPLFWAGYLLAELSPSLAADPEPRRQSRRSTATWTLLLLTGLYSASYPYWDAANSPGYRWLSALSPWPPAIAARWWSDLGAVLVVAALDRLALAKRFLSSPPVAYMGRISFSLYLVHFWILHTLGQVVFHYAYSVFGVDTSAGAVCGFVVGYAGLMCIVIWISDLFMRVVDAPSVRLGVAMERWFFGD